MDFRYFLYIQIVVAPKIILVNLFVPISVHDFSNFVIKKLFLTNVIVVTTVTDITVSNYLS